MGRGGVHLHFSTFRRRGRGEALYYAPAYPRLHNAFAHGGVHP